MILSLFLGILVLLFVVGCKLLYDGITAGS